MVIEIGTIALGKYTFPNMPWLFLKVSATPVNEIEKYPHSVLPANTKRKYGTPSDGIEAILPNIMNWVRDTNKGCMKNQSGPRIVCL